LKDPSRVTGTALTLAMIIDRYKVGECDESVTEHKIGGLMATLSSLIVGIMQMNAFNNKTFIVPPTIEQDQLKQRHEDAAHIFPPNNTHTQQINTSNQLEIVPNNINPQQPSQQTVLLDQPPPARLFLQSTLPQDQQLATPQAAQHTIHQPMIGQQTTIPQSTQPIIQTPGSAPPPNQPRDQQQITYNNQEPSFAFQQPSNPQLQLPPPPIQATQTPPPPPQMNTTPPPPPPSLTMVPPPPSYQPRPYFQTNYNQPELPAPPIGTNASLFTEENRGSFHHFPDAPDTWPAFAYHFGFQHDNTPHVQQSPLYMNPPRDYKPIRIYDGSTLTSSHDYNEWDKQAWHKVLLENPILDSRLDVQAITLWSALDVFLRETLLTKVTYNQQAMGTQVSMMRQYSAKSADSNG